MAKSSKTAAKKTTIPAEAKEADKAIRQQAGRVRERVAKMKEAEALAQDGHHAEAEQLMAEAKGEVQPSPKTKKVNGTTLRNAKSSTKKTPAKKAKRRTKGKRPNRHDGKDISYPKTAEEGLAHAEAVRERVRQCPPAKAAGIKTTADVKNPKSEVKMRKKQSVTKVTKGTKRKTTARKSNTRKAAAKKTPARKTNRKSGASGGRALGDFTNDQKITISKTAKKEAGDASKLRYAVLKSGMTVEKALAALNDKGFRGRRGWLRREREAGRITIK
jgi:hypothetical protein